ncbi:hypothetical protein O6H91_22G020700 [Diphasiastrum complanatum]|uniref:Uncharacterized protein n=2 Tax=Diphasiastrum complanatum TaxID=34168 RepID=A0ACC2ADI9_DIPCM|nr:hypothetical protein O6H91_22G018300 [Diphasiastrum complanatum]KAJ7515622.1 hypothetical protein O6H91_22G020700 [Diphasiastrum complanatum]
MAQAAHVSLLLFLAVTAGIYVFVSAVYGGDKRAFAESIKMHSESLGNWAMPVFVLVHTVAIAFCFPYAIAFEAAAAFIFGFFNGVLCVFCAKVSGAALAFWLGRALFRSSTSATNFVRKNKYFSIVRDGVARDGWKFVLLARFSPVPSYVVNYTLAATDIHFFVDFLLPTLAGGIPMILQNTSLGTLTSVAANVGHESKRSGPLSYILPILGILSGVLITWRIKKYASQGQHFVEVQSNPEVSNEQKEDKNSPQNSASRGVSESSDAFVRNLHQRSSKCSSG